MTTYHYILASQKFLLEEEPLDEVLRERERNYRENNKEKDFWLVKQPGFLEAPEFSSSKAKCPQPSVAIITTDEKLAIWLKLRLEFVEKGEFEAPSTTIPDPLASLSIVA
jgi:hypothetical protein